MSTPIIYMIRHGEKPPNGGVGLNQAGNWRADHLPGVFGNGTGYNIKYILAEKWKEDGQDDRPYNTVLPLSLSLGLTIDDRFKRVDSQGVADAVAAFGGPGNVLICWEHQALTDVATAIGVVNAPKYDGTHFDYLWTLTNGNTQIVQTEYSIPPDPAGTSSDS